MSRLSGFELLGYQRAELYFSSTGTWVVTEMSTGDGKRESMRHMIWGPLKTPACAEYKRGPLCYCWYVLTKGLVLPRKGHKSHLGDLYMARFIFHEIYNYGITYF